MDSKVRMGMIGGSKDGFIGNVHRMAAALDGKIELLAGAFSSNPARSKEMSSILGIPKTRAYDSFEEMIVAEKQLPDDKRIEFISIVTPNHLHFSAAKLALENGFHVLCEKPMTFNFEEAMSLQKIVVQSNALFGLTHNYTAYPMVKEARALVHSGVIGKIRKVIAEYPQGWLSAGIEFSGQKQAEWRTNPSFAGMSCCVADIGTHAENLAEYITGLSIQEVAADIHSFVDGRLLEDDASILLRFDSGAKGVLIASQIASGDENELKIRIYGERGGLEWLQSNPNMLILKNEDGSAKVLKAGSGNTYLSEHARVHTRTPGGHPEGYLESMANIYRNFALAINARKKDKAFVKDHLYDYPSIEDGVRGMKFIEAVIESGKNNSTWVKI